MSERVAITANNMTSYTLSQFKLWGGPYGTEPPKVISPNQQGIKFTLDDNDRAGVVYLATDSQGNEMGYVAMSYTCPKLSSNSAEGSPDVDGIFISAGLQTYSESGTPVDFTFNIGQQNLASWDSGSSYSPDLACDQTSLEEWGRVLVSVNNPLANDLVYKGVWNNGTWVKAPQTVPANGKRIFFLNDNDRAGINYSLNDNIPINMSFTCPKLSSNSAEGSPLAGLRQYPEHGTPALFNYTISDVNQACWSSGNSNDGEIEVAETNVGKMSSWMSDSLSTIGNMTLKEISIPGSHDAGMSSSHDGTVGAKDCNTQTQTQTILGQLEYGSRYYDIRPIIGSGDYETGHYSYIGSVLDMQGARGESISDIIDDVNTFTASNNELVILNFSHDMDTDNKNSSGHYPPFTVDQWHSLFDKLKQINYLYLVNDYPDLTSIELNTLITNKPCVLLVIDTDTSTIDPYKGQGFFPLSSLNPYNSYSDSNSFDTMSKDQLKKMNAQCSANNYFLLSWTLTQDGTQAVTCPVASSILDLAETADGMLSQTLLPAISSKVFPNIIYIDDFSTGNATAISSYINQYVVQSKPLVTVTGELNNPKEQSVVHN